MTRPEILRIINEQLSACYSSETVEMIMASIEGELAELDATPPYPEESDFQALLSEQFYPFLALMHTFEGIKMGPGSLGGAISDSTYPE